MPGLPSILTLIIQPLLELNHLLLRLITMMTPKTLVALLSLAAASVAVSVTPRASENQYYVNLVFGNEKWNTCSGIANAAAVLTAKKPACEVTKYFGTGADCVVPDNKCATFKKACDAFGGHLPAKVRC
ncbi:hypothetical protein HGRIS_014045 [Hohenbuehelia grisea]|uniref:Uncharacterized protein n=1 Tax=Hohenbuehelia grisea TaxID=104357 RepID=A0ABR3JS78_9AGAR